MKVAFVGGSKLDSFRGIGANTLELINALKELGDIEVIDNFKRADIVHFTKFDPFFIALPFLKPKNQKWVLTIHDLIPLIYPNYYQPGLKGKIRYFINKVLIKRYVDKIVTITETSKKDICRFLSVNPEMVKVIYIAPKSAIKKLKPGNWQEETRKKFNLPEQFVLFDHGVNYNKNLLNLAKACKLINANLVIVGKEAKDVKERGVTNFRIFRGPRDVLRNLFQIPHPQVKQLSEMYDLFKNREIITAGYVSDDDLNKLFNLATVCVQPSFYEGFGMPVIEAMTVGTPVVASKIQALVEIAEESALFCDPMDVSDMANKIKMMLNSEKLRNRYIKRGLSNAKKFSWEKCAKETLEVYENV